MLFLALTWYKFFNSLSSLERLSYPLAHLNVNFKLLGYSLLLTWLPHRGPHVFHSNCMLGISSIWLKPVRMKTPVQLMTYYFDILNALSCWSQNYTFVCLLSIHPPG